MSKRQNVFHVKIKVIPPAGYKPKFHQGIVYASNPSRAGEAAINLIKGTMHTSSDGEPVECALKVFKVEKLRADFLTNDKTL